MIVVLADCHVGRGAGDEGSLLDLLAHLRPGEVRELVLLGDTFQYLIAHPTFETPVIRKVLDELGRLGSRGIPVHFVEGNRDFFVAGSHLEPLFASVSEGERRFGIGGATIVVTHGDRINEADLPYRTWRFLSKNRLSRAFVGLVPPLLARRVVARTEARLDRTNFRHKRRFPREAVLAYARKQWEKGATAVLLGHFHEEWQGEGPDGRIVAVVPAFFSSGKVGVVSNDGRYRTVRAEKLVTP